MPAVRHAGPVVRPGRAPARFMAITVLLAVVLGSVHCGKDQPTTPDSIPTRLAFTAQPTSVIAGSSIAPAVQATVQDAQGNTVASSTATVTLAISGGTGSAGAVLGGTLSRAAVNGVATFSDLTIDKAGAGYTLTATATDLTGATSTTFSVNVSDASRLAFTAQPTSVIAGSSIAPAVQATVQDAQGNTVASSTATVTLAISGGTGSAGAVLGGTLSRAPVNGVATFSDLTIDKAGAGYTLTATAASLASATSTPFNVTAFAGVPTSISLQSDAGDYIGQGLTYQYTQANASITVTVTGGHLALNMTGDQRWSADFQTPNTLTQLAPGMYSDLHRYPFHDPAKGGLSWYGEGRGCNTLTGWFAVDTVTYRNGILAEIDLRFEQHCEGGTPALHGTIHWASDDPTRPPGPVNPIPAGLWRPAAGSTPTAGNYVYLASEVGDYVGAGQTLTYTPANAAIAVTAANGHLSVTVSGWFGDFQAMSTLTDLQPGYYADLRRYPFHNPAKGGLSWSGQGRGCNTLTGWFAIDSVTYLNGILTAIDLRFEQHCEGGTPALHGAIHWAG